MKTIKKISIAIIAVWIIGITVQLIMPSVKNVRASLRESTHQGYRSMVADYIF